MITESCHVLHGIGGLKPKCLIALWMFSQLLIFLKRKNKKLHSRCLFSRHKCLKPNDNLFTFLKNREKRLKPDDIWHLL